MYNFRAIGKAETTIIKVKKNSLKTLDLRACHLSKIPPTIYTDHKFSTTLVTVDLSNNSITELPPEFWSFKNVEKLLLHHNQLKVVDSGLKLLVKLTHLDISHNSLQIIPPGITCLKHLKTLNLVANKIHHFDRSLLLLPSLSKLLISQNPIKNLSLDLCCASVSTLRKHFKLGLHHDSPRGKKVREILSKTPRKIKCKILTENVNDCDTEGTLSTSQNTELKKTELKPMEDKCNKPILKQHEKMCIKCGSSQVDIPKHQSIHAHSAYSIKITKDKSLYPKCLDDQNFLATPVVILSPHDVCFNDTPAIISLPITVSIESSDDIMCLHSKSEAEPKWEELPRSQFSFNENKTVLKITVTHFSMFCAILRKPYPETSKLIPHTSGGTIEIEKVPGAKIIVPDSALTKDVEICMKIVYDESKMAQDTIHSEPLALATPIAKLEPSGLKFEKPVTVTLPLPDCDEIESQFDQDSETNLTIWCAQNDASEWKEVKVKYKINRDNNDLCTISFPVRHFSWYKALWSCMARTIHKAKLGCAHYYPSVQFSMMCKAMLDYQPGSSSFGLEVLCYRGDEQPQETGQFVTAGGSLKPRMVRTGDLLVKLVSNCFEADVENGEVRELMKYEFNFKGYEFEKQFACLDKKLPKHRGVFGKVFVDRVIQKGLTEPLFEFNLIKKEEPKTDSLGIVAIIELAGILNIDNDLGILSMCGKLTLPLDTTSRNSKEPFAELLSAYQSKGGNTDKFVEVMYEVSRSLRPTAPSPVAKRRKSRSQRNSRPLTPDDDLHKLLSISPNTPSTPGPFDDLLNEIDQSERSTPKRKRPDDVIDGCAILPSKRQCVAAEDIMETSVLNDAGDPDEILDETHLNNETEMEDLKLWALSEGLAHKWRSIARTLQVPEFEILCLEQKYGSDIRECAYQMLLTFRSQYPEKCTYGQMYKKLCRNGLRLVAQKYCTAKSKV